MVKLPFHITHGLQAFRRLTIIRNNLALYKRTVTWMLGIRVPFSSISSYPMFLVPECRVERGQRGKCGAREGVLGLCLLFCGVW